MPIGVKKILKNIKLYFDEYLKIREWLNDGMLSRPPHIIKQKVLRAYSVKYDLKILVETGTFHGDMIEALCKDFEEIYSIELSEELFLKAKRRFSKDQHIEIIQGDSGKVLKDVMDKIKKPTLFWLDGHYSAGITARGETDTPIKKELNHILNSIDRDFVILIDDARCFRTDPAYPNLEELKKYVISLKGDVSFNVEQDIIRIIPIDSK